MILRTPLASDSLLLLVAHPSRIVSISLSDMSLTLLVSDCGPTPSGITFDAKQRQVFWTNADRSRNDGFIERVDIDGSNRVEVVPCGNKSTPKQIVADGEQGYLYWADCESMRVLRSRLDGTQITVLIQFGEADEYCVGIAVDCGNGHIYWTQKSSPPNSIGGRIFRTSLDLPAGVTPENRSDIEAVLADLPEPVYLQWEENNGFLYWTDCTFSPSGNTLNRAKYVDGRLVEPEILLSGLGKGIALALDVSHGRAFVSDLGGSVRVMKLDRPGESEVIFSGHGPLMGIVYVPVADRIDRSACTIPLS
jgi:DNA-binding beta-propeller fold protein YncE